MGFKQRQPFSNKQFVEDIQRPDQDFRETKLSDKLPKIEYGSAKQFPQAAEPTVATPESEKAREQQMLRDMNVYAAVTPATVSM